jgi:hypothetical protein
MKHLSEEFHGYVGSIAHLKDGRSVKIVGGEGLKLYVQAIDGEVFECYHDQLETIFAE